MQVEIWVESGGYAIYQGAAFTRSERRANRRRASLDRQTMKAARHMGCLLSYTDGGRDIWIMWVGSFVFTSTSSLTLPSVCLCTRASLNMHQLRSYVCMHGHIHTCIDIHTSAYIPIRESISICVSTYLLPAVRARELMFSPSLSFSLSVFLDLPFFLYMSGSLSLFLSTVYISV